MWVDQEVKIQTVVAYSSVKEKVTGRYGTSIDHCRYRQEGYGYRLIPSFADDRNGCAVGNHAVIITNDLLVAFRKGNDHVPSQHSSLLQKFNGGVKGLAIGYWDMCTSCYSRSI